MPKKRQPKEVWTVTRKRIWLRDKKCCVRCKVNVEINTCHIDHIKSGKLGSNEDSNLRTLCRKCHVLRADLKHRGMVAKALADGIIPSNWRHFVWED
ncbi:HNH endonuclease [Metabacillus sp. JX24]|uniref:HNH endonuclease n=1 Tax=Metabacillus sp. JX24 TaxID=3240759 RepID=UPI00350F23CD